MPLTQPITLPTKVGNGLLGLFFVLVFIQTVIVGYHHLNTHNLWAIGSWLINYTGGFVRRGLLGEGALTLAQLTSLEAKHWVLGIQLCCYAVYFYCSYRLLIRQRQVGRYFLLIGSPFIFLFQVYDPQGGFRQEILFFALFAYNAYARATFTTQNRALVGWLSLFVYPLLILSHELLAALLPLLLLMHKDVFCTNKAAVYLTASGILINILVFASTLYFSGNEAMALAICQSLADFCNTTYALHSGPVIWLTYDTQAGFDAVTDFFFNLPAVSKHALLIILVVIGYWPLRQHLYALWQGPYAKGLLLLSLAGLITAAVIAIDWGRLLYIAAVCVLLLSLCYQPAAPRKNPASYQATPLGLIGLAAYASLWRIPHCCDLSMLNPLWLGDYWHYIIR